MPSTPRLAVAAPSASPSRRAVAGLMLAGLVSACSRVSGPAHVEEIPDIGYVPADPQKGLSLINAYRAENGIAPLAFDADLQRIASEYVQHLAAAGVMTHDLEPWGGLERRLKAAGYPYSSGGENLGQGYRTLEQVIAGWKRSPAHDRGMKDPDQTRMGIASAANGAKRGDYYWCLVLARPRAAGAPVGTGPFAPSPAKPAGSGARIWGSLPIPFIGR